MLYNKPVAVIDSQIERLKAIKALSNIELLSGYSKDHQSDYFLNQRLINIESFGSSLCESDKLKCPAKKSEIINIFNLIKDKLQPNGKNFE